MREIIQVSLILIFSVYTIYYFLLFSKTFNIDFDYEHLSNDEFTSEYINAKKKQRSFILILSRIDFVIGLIGIFIGTFTPIYGMTIGFLYIGIISIVKFLLTTYFIWIIDSEDEKTDLSFKEKLSYFKEVKDIEILIKTLENDEHEFRQ